MNIINLKNLFLAGILSTIFVSCQKENSLEVSKNESNSLPKEIQLISSSIPNLNFEVRGVFVWDEWGRKKRDCRGGGLCNFRLFDIVPSVTKSSMVYYFSALNRAFVTIEIDNEFEFEDESKVLYIDEDIIQTAPDGTIFKLKAGNYPYNSTIGEIGGYVLSLDEI